MGEAPVRSPWVPRLIVAVGVVAALIMGWLGLWQAQVFADQGKSAAAAITGEPVRALDASVTGDNVGGRGDTPCRSRVTTCPMSRCSS